MQRRVENMESKFVDSREWLIDRLARNLLEGDHLSNIHRVLILGGGMGEPELRIFSQMKVEIHHAGISSDTPENNFHIVDLNNAVGLPITFDIVICNQVLEHLYNLDNAFNVMENLVGKGGLIWITCPANNYRHGSPNFFSAGYSREFLETNMLKRGFIDVDTGEVSSRRVYLYRHLMQIWPTEKQIRNPLFSYFGVSGKISLKLIYNLKTIFWRLALSLTSRDLRVNGEYPIETYGLFKKSG